MMTFSGLHGAVQRGNCEAVFAFLEQGTDINSRDEEFGWTPLKVAARFCRIDAARTLFERGAQDAISQKEFGEALMFAARSHSAELIRLFHQNGRHLLTTKLLNGALDVAAFQSFYETLSPLVEYGAEVTDACFIQASGSTVFSDGSNAQSSIQIISFLLDHGIDVNVKDRDKRTALMRAAGAGNPGVVRLLISCGAKLNTRDVRGKTALKYAAETRNTATLDVLTDAGAKF